MSLTDNFRTDFDPSYRHAAPASPAYGQISNSVFGLAYSMLYAVGRDAKPYFQDSRSALVEVGQKLIAALTLWRERRHFRKELSRLLGVAPHMIGDIGLTVEVAAAEVARPFWRA
jgi:uncharacterized protein YjiS (DUF1127 family)